MELSTGSTPMDVYRAVLKETGDHKEAKKAHDKAYREANKEQIAARKKDIYKADKEQIAVRDKAYRDANRDKIAARNKAWQEANTARDRFRTNSRRGRAHKHAAPPWLSKEQWEQMNATYAGAKRLTERLGRQFSVDHIVPFNGQGVSGLHVPWNLQVLEIGNNNSKGVTYDPDGHHPIEPGLQGEGLGTTAIR